MSLSTDVSALDITEYNRLGYCSASALLAMPTAVLGRGILFVCPSFRHIPVFCLEEWKYDRAVFSVT